MKNIQKLILVLLFISLFGCQSPAHREPSSLTVSDLKILKQRRVELSALSFHFHKEKNAYQLAKIANEQKSIEEKIHEIESRSRVL